MKAILIIAMVCLMPGVLTKESPDAAVHVVRIEGMKFIPKSLDVRVGETVLWINNTGHSHNVIASDGSYKSEMLTNRGDKFKYTFTITGEFNYYCEPHRTMGMKGKIIVKDALTPQ
jgi:plastocyanin